MKNQRKYFGTDGIRGEVGKHPITPDFVLRLGWAAGKVLSKKERGRVLIGKDTRISGYIFESVLEAGFAAAGVDVRLLGPMPTPAIAYLTRTLNACAGVVISASHNSYKDNGIKFFSADGTKLPDEVELEIESRLELPLQSVGASELGRAERVTDAAGRYIEFCKSTVPHRLDLKGLRIVLDCAHGATYHVAPAVFDELGAEVIATAAAPNGLNINEKCGAVSPAALQQAVLERRADLGIAFDGDGDRVMMVDANGELVDGDEILLMIARERLDAGSLKGPVVGTLMSNLGLQEALKRHGVELLRARVGDRYVMEALVEHDATIGGETSGHIICRDRVTSGDAIVSALQVLLALQDVGKPLAEHKLGMQKHPQVLLNVRLPRAMDVISLPRVEQAVHDAETSLQGHGRVLLRPSGTEPVVRVMVEGRDGNQVDLLARQIADEVEAVIAAG
jgi:phosphoglucosamine mutase